MAEFMPLPRAVALHPHKEGGAVWVGLATLKLAEPEKGPEPQPAGPGLVCFMLPTSQLSTPFLIGF